MDVIPLDLLVRWLSWILLHFVWQGAVIGGLLWIALKFVSPYASNARYGMACGALMLMASLPGVTGVLLSRNVRSTPQLLTSEGIPEWRFQSEVLPSTALIASRHRSDIAGQPHRANVAASFNWSTLFEPLIQRWPGMVVVTWLSGVAVFGARLILSLCAVRRLRSSAVVITDSVLIGVISSLVKRLKVRAGVQLMRTARVRVPLVLGWLRPVILIPASLASSLTIEQIEAVLAHELAHIKRHDYLINVLQSLIETLLFYHPAVWWVSRVIRDEREHCCDAIALQMIGNRQVYAQALFELARQTVEPTSLTVAVDGGPLADRVRRILGFPTAKSVVVWPTTILLAGLLLVLLVTAAPLFRNSMRNAEDRQLALPDAKSKMDNENAADGNGVVPKVEFVVAQHQLFYKGLIVTFEDIERIIDKETALHGKIQPAFQQTIGGFQRMEKLPINQLHKRLFDSNKLNGIDIGTMSARASGRYDRIESYEDLVSGKLVRHSGKVVDSEGQPVVDAEIVLLPIDWPGGLSLLLREGHVRDPLNEHVVNSDELGRFEVGIEPDEKLIVGIHPQGFVMTTLKDFEIERVLRLQPWSRVHGRAVLDENSMQSIRLSVTRMNVLFNFDEIPVAQDGTFNQDFVPPGSIVAQRSFSPDGLFGYLVPVGSSPLKPGESAEVNVGRISDHQMEIQQDFENQRIGNKSQETLVSELKSLDIDQVVSTTNSSTCVTFTIARNVLVHRRQFVTWDQVEQILNDACEQHGRIQPVFLLTRSCSDPSTKLAEIYARLSQKNETEPFAINNASSRISSRYDGLPRVPVAYADRLHVKGHVVDPAGVPQNNADILLLSNVLTMFPGEQNDRRGIDLRDGRLENPNDEYSVVSDQGGRFEIVAEIGEQIIVGLHPSGFAMTTIAEFNADQVLRLKPWSRVHWRTSQNEAARHSFWISCQPSLESASPPVFNVWSKRANIEGIFEEKCVMPGSVTLRRIDPDSKNVSSHRTLKRDLVSGETTEFDGQQFASAGEFKNLPVSIRPALVASPIHWPSKKADQSRGPNQSTNQVTFVFAQHVQIHDDRIVTWEEIEEILNKEYEAHGIVTPVFVNTLGAATRQNEINSKRSQLYRRLFEQDRVHGVRSRVASMRASARYDRLHLAVDLVSLGSQIRTGCIVDLNGDPVAGADVLLIPTADQNVAVHLWNGQLRDPYDEHRVLTDARGRFSIRSEIEEEHLAAIHESGFCLLSLSSFTNEQSVKLEPWSRLHGTVAEDRDEKQSIHFVSQPARRVELHVWDTEIAANRSFDQRFVPPGTIAVQRSIETPRGVPSYVTTQQLGLMPGQSESISLGPIPREQSPRYQLRHLESDELPTRVKKPSSILNVPNSTFKLRTVPADAVPEQKGTP